MYLFTYCKFRSAAIYCRDVLECASSRTVFLYFGWRNVSYCCNILECGTSLCRFRIAVRLLSLLFIYFPTLPFQHTSTHARLNISKWKTFTTRFLQYVRKDITLSSTRKYDDELVKTWKCVCWCRYRWYIRRFCYSNR